MSTMNYEPPNTQYAGVYPERSRRANRCTFLYCPNCACVPLLLCALQSEISETTKDYVRNYQRNMQNKPNVKDAQINVNSYMKSIYEKLDTWLSGKNKPNLVRPALFAKELPDWSKAKIACQKIWPRPPAYTVRQLFDIIVLYKYHLPIINPFTAL